MVSAVVLNRDGRSHLEQLLEGLTRTTDYPAIELVVVDNGSDDDSVEFLRGADPPFPVKVAENEGNASFSEGCNQGAELGSGDLLLFLNNDIELFEPGWLRELVGCLERSSAHAVGATLLHGETSAARIGAGSSWVLQHRGVNFGRQLGYVVPLNVADGDPLWPSVGSDRPSLGATAACLLVDRSAFDSVAGFTVGFQYGWEDVDLGLKLISSGRSVVCSGRSFAFHDEGATRRARERGFRRHNRAVNQRLFMRRWGPAVYRSYLLDRLTGGTLWSHDDKAHLGVVGDPADLDRLPVGGLATGLRDHGWRVTAVPAGEDEPPDDLDCALVVSAECAPPAESVVSVAWVGWPPAAWIDQGRLPSFELVLAESPDIAQELEKRTGREVIVPPPLSSAS
jgi:GT2 family glycosyltransferase